MLKNVSVVKGVEKKLEGSQLQLASSVSDVKQQVLTLQHTVSSLTTTTTTPPAPQSQLAPGATMQPPSRSTRRRRDVGHTNETDNDDSLSRNSEENYVPSPRQRKIDNTVIDEGFLLFDTNLKKLTSNSLRRFQDKNHNAVAYRDEDYNSIVTRDFHIGPASSGDSYRSAPDYTGQERKGEKDTKGVNSKRMRSGTVKLGKRKTCLKSVP